MALEAKPEIRFKGKSIADVLDMTVEEAAEFFKAVPAVRDKMETLVRVGLSYVKVGQSATTLSGGEAQRVTRQDGAVEARTGKTPRRPGRIAAKRASTC